MCNFVENHMTQVTSVLVCPFCTNRLLNQKEHMHIELWRWITPLLLHSNTCSVSLKSESILKCISDKEFIGEIVLIPGRFGSVLDYNFGTFFMEERIKRILGQLL